MKNTNDFSKCKVVFTVNNKMRFCYHNGMVHDYIEDSDNDIFLIKK